MCVCVCVYVCVCAFLGSSGDRSVLVYVELILQEKKLAVDFLRGWWRWRWWVKGGLGDGGALSWTKGPEEEEEKMGGGQGGHVEGWR